jgi:predicted HD phosphohydrolase
MSTKQLPEATFTRMQDANRDDYQVILHHSLNFMQGLPGRILTHLQLLAGDTGGYAIDRLSHSVQTATRAHRDGRDEEYVVCALLHDIGDTLASTNHADLAATILQPFVSEKNHWIVKHHGIFQGYYFFHHLGLDRNMRDRYRDHPYWRDCAEFCAKYDQNSFDPEYDNLPLDLFEPMLRRLFAAPRRSIYFGNEQSTKEE